MFCCHTDAASWLQDWGISRVYDSLWEPLESSFHSTRCPFFVCPSTPFFLDTLGLRHGDLKESAQKSYVLYQDFEFNHLSKRKRASPAHVSFKNVHCFSILGFLSCLVHLALIVKINENYIKIHRYQKGQLLFLKSSFHLVEHELYSLYFA